MPKATKDEVITQLRKEVARLKRLVAMHEAGRLVSARRNSKVDAFIAALLDLTETSDVE